MRERTARLIESLLLALLRALLPPQGGRHRAALPQPLAEQRPLTPPPHRPAHICPCERERILQRRRAHWIAAYGIDAPPRRIHGEKTPA